MGTDAVINSWKFHFDFLRSVVTAQWQIFLKVVSLDLTWPCSKNSIECLQWMTLKSQKVSARYLQPFGNGTRKTWAGSFWSPALAKNRVNLARLRRVKLEISGASGVGRGNVWRPPPPPTASTSCRDLVPATGQASVRTSCADANDASELASCLEHRCRYFFRAGCDTCKNLSNARLNGATKEWTFAFFAPLRTKNAHPAFFYWKLANFCIKILRSFRLFSKFRN